MSDLKLIDGDLSINPSTSDLDYFIKEEDSIRDSLIRRIKTLKLQYAVNYYDYDNLRFTLLDLEYGSNVYKYLAYPINIVEQQLYNELQLSLLEESRISVQNISINKTVNYSISFQVEYKYADTLYIIET